MPLPQPIFRPSSLRVAVLPLVTVAVWLAFGSPLARAGTVTANPPNLNFGDVQIGKNSTLPVVLTNNGTSTVIISQGRVQGAGFRVTVVKLPIILNPQQNFTINVTFAPLADGSYSGNVSGSNSSGPIVEIPVSGNGTQSGYSVALSWDPSKSQVEGYNVYRAIKSGGPYTKINSILDPSTTYVDDTVLAGQTYYYVTTAVNSAGEESKYSNQAEAAIP